MDSKLDVDEESEIISNNKPVSSQELLDKLIPKLTQINLNDYYTNTLFHKNPETKENDTNFTKGLKPSDYDVVLSSVNAENSELFHSLNICNCNFDPTTPPSRKVILYEDLAKIMTNFMNWKNNDKGSFADIYIHSYPLVRKNLQFNISELTFKIVKDDKVIDYKMEQNKDTKKDIVYFIMFKLVKPDEEEEKKEEEKKEEKKWPREHKFGKIEQLLEQFEDKETKMEVGGWSLQEFWKYYKYAYFIFCVEDESDIMDNYKLFPPWMKEVNEKYKSKAKIIYFIDPPGQDKSQILNIFKINDLGKNYYFMMKSDNVIYEADSMLCSGDIVENSIKKKKKEEEENQKLSKEELNKERIKAISDFCDLIKNINKYRYNFYIGYQLKICFKFNEKNELCFSYAHFSHLIAEVKTKEYNIIKKCADLFRPDIEDVQEIKVKDIPIDFTENYCKVCKKEIKDDEPMFYCYKCDDKPKYCEKCVIDNFNKNEKLKKFIDPKHNLLYFKTRNVDSFKNIEEYKLGHDSFAECKDPNKIGPHSFSCNGCQNDDIKNQPRFLCLNCRPGMLQDNGYNDFCIHCIGNMNKGNNDISKKIHETKDKIFNQEIRFFENNEESMSHDHENHIYLMLPLEYKKDDNNGYYDF